jgi:hypothetical protein
MVEGDICVDPSAGDDLAAGTADAPVKTITHALELVGKQGSGRTVFLLDGTYDAPGGEQFPLNIPTTITVSGISTVHGSEIEVVAAATASAARIVGEGAIVKMAGGSTLSHAIVISQGSSTSALDVDGATYGVHLTDVFAYGTKASPIVVHGGELTVDDVHLGPQLELQQDGWITGTKLTLGVAESTATNLKGRIEVDSGTLRFRGGGNFNLYAKLEATHLDVDSDGDVSDAEPFAAFSPMPPYLIYAVESTASVAVTGGTWKNVWLQDRFLDSATQTVFSLGDVVLSSSVLGCIARPCELTGATVSVGTELWITERLTVTGSTFTDSWIYAATGSNVKVRSSTFGNGASIVADASALEISKLDLGKPGDAGGNTFAGTPGANERIPNVTAFLVIGTWYDSTVWAGGNTWLPNESGADAQGHFAAGEVSGHLMGKNIYNSSDASVTF